MNDDVSQIVKQRLFDLGLNVLLFVLALGFLWMSISSLKAKPMGAEVAAPEENESVQQYSRHKRVNSR